MSNNLNKVYGAINLVSGVGSLVSYNENMLHDGDVGFIVSGNHFYIYKLTSSVIYPDSIEPFDEKNPPLVLKPVGNPSTAKRWALIFSSKYVVNDIFFTGISNVVFEKLLVGDDFKIIDKTTNTVILEYKDGKVNIPELVTTNLKVETINGILTSLFVLRDGSRGFLNPVVGVLPIEKEHLATKEYVDNEVFRIDYDNIMKRDGTTAFSAPVLGIYPTEELHLTPKKYVDDEIREVIDEVTDVVNNFAKDLDHRVVIKSTSITDDYTPISRELIFINEMQTKDITILLKEDCSLGDVIYIRNYNKTNFNVFVDPNKLGRFVEDKPQLLLDTKIKSFTLAFDGDNWYMLNATT